jgi:hypothetical protein
MATDKAHVTLDGNGGKEGRSVFCLEFVNMNASSRAEKQRNRKVIRSTAMKNFRRRQQSQRTQVKDASRTNSEIRRSHLAQRTKEKKISNKEDGEEHKEQVIYIKEEFDQDLQDASSLAVDGWMFETTSNRWWLESRTVSSSKHNEGLWDSEALQMESSPSHLTSKDFFTLNSPLTVLGGGRIDPFRIYPEEYVDPHVHELIDHCEFRSFQKTYLLLNIAYEPRLTATGKQPHLPCGPAYDHVPQAEKRIRFHQRG